MIYITFKHSFLIPSLALFAAVVISGCSSSTTTPPPPPTPSNVYPAKGSSYTYTASQTDSSGNITGSSTTVISTVTDSGKTFFGQSGSYTISSPGDTNHFAYSGSNDALIYIQNSGATGILASVGDTILHRWITLSIASHATGVVILDSMPITVVVSSFPIAAKVHLVATYVGSDSVHLANGESLFVQHCQINATATSDPSFIIPKPVTLTNTRDIYFAPKIGTFAKETTFTIIPAAVGMPGSKGGTVQVLTSYTLK
jgi:hypothetical protein